jgi:hypothetical protein
MPSEFGQIASRPPAELCADIVQIRTLEHQTDWTWKSAIPGGAWSRAGALHESVRSSGSLDGIAGYEPVAVGSQERCDCGDITRVACPPGRGSFG